MPLPCRPILSAVAAAAVAASTAGVVADIAMASTRTPEIIASAKVAKSAEPRPLGVGGHWKLTYDDEFNGKSLSRRAWALHNDWQQNDVTDKASNVSESGGTVNLMVSSESVGAEIAARRVRLRVGDFAEARIEMPGKGRELEDWDAFWATGEAWHAGENDVAESLRGKLTVNYHCWLSGTHNKGSVSGSWAGAFHTYGIYRGRNYVSVYYAGRRVKHYRTDDDGNAETVIFTVGIGARDPSVTGKAGTMRVDFLRVWRRPQ